MKINARYRYMIGIFMLLCIPVGLYFFYYRSSYVKTLLPITELLKEKNLVPVVVIGSGPAGLSAALFTARADFKTLVIAGQQEGGQLMEAAYVENWPSKQKMSGSDMMRDLKNQAERFGTKVITASVDHVDFSKYPYTIHLNNGQIIKALSVIIATGGAQRLLPIPGAKEYLGKGVGICTICDAPFDKDKEVVVIGGGDAACDKALQLAAFAKQVTLLVRDKEMRAAAVVQNYVKNTKNIAFRYSIQVEKIIGDSNRVSAIEFRDVKTGKTETMPIHSVYFALGFIPNSELFKNDIATDNNGYISLFDQVQKTSIKGVFAAGNVEDKIYQKASVAAGAGVRAGLDAITFLQENGYSPTALEQLKALFYDDSKSCKYASVSIATLEELQKIIGEHEGVIIDFYSKTCPICKMLAPGFEQACAELAGAVTFVLFDIQNSNNVMQHYSIEATPTLILMRDGKEVSRSTTLRTKQDILDFIKKNKK